MIGFYAMNSDLAERRKTMAYSTRYAKPNMANLPSKLGRAIFQQILNTPKPDDAKLDEEARRLKREMIKVRDREDAQRHTTK